MARRRKQETEEMRELRQKIAGMRSIDVNFDAGSNVTLVEAVTILKDADDALGDYNQEIAKCDEKDNIFDDKVKVIRAFNKKVLPATGLKYGTDSSEYEQMGGTRESERKKPVRKVKDK